MLADLRQQNAKMRHFRAHGGGLQYGFVFLCIAFSVDVMDVTRAHSVLIFSSRKFIISSGSVSRRFHLFEAI